MARSESWRVLLTLAINKGWKVLQWDVKAAYLQAPLDHEIFVKDLKENRETEYWKLHKALYGLKQVGHQWYNRMREIMTKTAGLTQCIGDSGCFYLPGQSIDIIVSTHVDDMAGYGTMAALTAFEKAVESEVELEKLGKPTKLLVMELTWENDEYVRLTQRDSIDKMLKEHNIPLTPQHSIPQHGYEPSEELLPDPTKYQSLVGSLLYINRMTRPDISLHVNLLGRQTLKPSPDNLRTAKRLGQCLASTKDEGLILTTKESPRPPDEKGVPIKLYADAPSSAKTHFWIPAGFRWISEDFADFLDFLDFKPEIQTEGFTASGMAAVDSAATQSNFARICSQPNKLCSDLQPAK